MTASLADRVDACFSEQDERLMTLEEYVQAALRGEVEVHEVVTVTPLRGRS